MILHKDEVKPRPSVNILQVQVESNWLLSHKKLCFLDVTTNLTGFISIIFDMGLGVAVVTFEEYFYLLSQIHG